LALLPGRFWEYALDGGSTFRVACEIGLWGEAWLAGSSGARCRATAGMVGLGLHGREGPADAVFDAFALAFSWMPWDASAKSWVDEPDANLSLHGALCGPVMAWRAFRGQGASSRFERSWDGLAEGWEQLGFHGLSGIGGMERSTIRTKALLLDGPGFGGFSASGRGLGSRPVKARLARWGNLGDHGVPGWSRVEANMGRSGH
jgi:hypothetical protein